MVIGLLIVLFLWFRPQGILPERRRVIVGKRPGRRRALASPPRRADGATGRPTPTGGPTSTCLAGLATAIITPREPFPGRVILRCSGLTRSFEGVRAVDDVSMSFERGRLTGIIGPNGAGKSTTLAMLAGTLKPDRREIISFRGEDITGWPPTGAPAWGSSAPSSWRASSSA